MNLEHEAYEGELRGLRALLAKVLQAAPLPEITSPDALKMAVMYVNGFFDAQDELALSRLALANGHLGVAKGALPKLIEFYLADRHRIVEKTAELAYNPPTNMETEK